MKIEPLMTDATILQELGERLARVRLDLNLTQSALARQAGVGLSTVQRLEAGVTTGTLRGFLRVCRVLDLIGRFDLVVPEPVVSPMQLLKLKGRARKRASGHTRIAETPGKWTWGKES